MSKRNLLQIVQEILDEGAGDEVNSIDDTFESETVAGIVRSTFNSMMVNKDWPHTRSLAQLTPSGDSALPTYMTLPTNIKKIISVNYNKIKSGETRRVYEPVHYLDPDDFLRRVNSLNSDNSNVDSMVDPSGVIISVRNDVSPTYYTSFDDETLIFDSYDSAVSSTLENSKSQVTAYFFPQFVMSDTYVPDLPEFAFPALIEEAKSKSAIKLRQIEDTKAEQESRRQNSWLSQKDFQVAGGIRYPKYGRRRVKQLRDATFRNQN